MTGEARNPFHFGSPASGEYFADRGHELADIADRMLNGQNVILLSPRRYGKTSLLYAAMSRVRRRHGRTGYASLLRCTSERDVAEALLEGVLNGPLSWLRTQHARLNELLTRVRLAPKIEVDVNGNMRASLEPALAARDWRHAMTGTLRLLKDAGDEHRPVSLVLDEFQRVAEIDPNLPALFKVMADELQRVSLVFAGSKLHVMQRITVGPGAPLLGMGERFTLGGVPEREMVRFLRDRTRRGGKQMSEAAAATLFRVVDGIPNDVQRLAYEAFSVASREIDEETIETALEQIVDHRALEYEEAYVRLAPAQQRVLRSLARHPRTVVYGREFVHEVDVGSTNAIRKALEVLGDLELVARRGAAWTVTDAFLRKWLTASSP